MSDEIISPPVDQRVASELEFHIEMRTRELIARGIEPELARQQATERFGDFAQVRGTLNHIARKTERDMRRTRYLSELIHDARFALRMLARRRTFAAIAIGTLAIGIGAATAIYSVADGVLLRPLPFQEPDRIAAVWMTEPSLAKDPTISWLADATPMGNAEYQALRVKATRIRDLALWSAYTMVLTTDAGRERLGGAVITSTLMPMLRIHAAAGREFSTGDDALNGAKVVMLGWESWMSRFGGDQSIIGRSVVLDDKPRTVIGIMPPGFRVDRSADPPAFWLPALQDSSDIPARHNRNYHAIARLAPNATFEAATQELKGLVRTVTGDTLLSARVEQWQRDEARTARGPLYVLLGAVGLLLLIACVNVAILQLGEASGRAREISARAALGAGIGRLIRQLLVESSVISILSAVLGTALTWAMIKALLAIAPERLPGMDTVGINGRVLAFAMACAMLTGLLFGIVPALVAGRAGATALIRSGVGQTGRGTRRIQRAMVAAQLALSMVLLVEATLLARSLHELTSVEPGFTATKLVAVRITYDNNFDENRLRAMISEVLRQLRSRPGIERATAASQAPFATGYSSSPVQVQPAVGAPEPPKAQHTQQRYVMADYFNILGIKPIEGRLFTDDDRAGSELVALVTTAEVKRDFAGQSPIGRIVKQQNKMRRVVGVVPDIKYRGLTKEDEATIYLPIMQDPNAWPVFIVRTSSIASVEPMCKAILHDVAPRILVSSVKSIPDAIAKSYAAERFRTILISMFAFMAALLAAVGMYGVSVRAAARRNRELGIRMALGGTSANVARLLVGDAMSGVAIGIVIGVPSALYLGRAVAPYLFRISTSDPISYALVIALLVCATALASFLPARTASKSNPASVLRSD